MSKARAALLLTAALAACSGGDPIADGGRSRTAPAPVRVVRGALEDRFVLGGELAAVSSENLVVPRTPTWMLSIRWLAADGALVKKGDRVVEFDASSFASALSDKRLAVMRAGGELASERARAAGATADKEMELRRRQAELAKAQVEVKVPEDLYPRRLFQEKQLTVDRQQDALAKAQEELATERRASGLERTVKSLALTRAERELRELKQRLQELVLRAPRDGMVQIELNRREGRKFLEGDEAYPGWAVASMPRVDAMEVRARLHDVDDGTIREGMPVECVLDAYPDQIWKGRVQTVSALARADGREGLRRFFDVKVALDQTAPDRMRPGMSVRIEVIRRQVKDALLLPRVALQSRDGKTLVRLGEGAAAPVQAVEIDWCTELSCVVRAGLREGTAVHLTAPLARGPS
jgi:multidrug efflux pump subunit AcrA (membrane-fusion protein)